MVEEKGHGHLYRFHWTDRVKKAPEAPVAPEVGHSLGRPGNNSEPKPSLEIMTWWFVNSVWDKKNMSVDLFLSGECFAQNWGGLKMAWGNRRMGIRRTTIGTSIGNHQDHTIKITYLEVLHGGFMVGALGWLWFRNAYSNGLPLGLDRTGLSDLQVSWTFSTQELMNQRHQDHPSSGFDDGSTTAQARVLRYLDVLY